MNSAATHIRVGIVENHPAVILGVKAMLDSQPDMQLVAAAGTVPELMATATRLDVVLLDLALDDGSSPQENMRGLTRAGAFVLAYSSGDRPNLVREASRSGIIGMIQKSVPPGEFLAAVRSAAVGEVVATAEWSAALESDTGFVSSSLSAREAEVLALYAAGETAESVASELFISRETVLFHIRRIRAKYAAVGRAAKSKIDLHYRALEDGILAPSEPS